MVTLLLLHVAGNRAHGIFDQLNRRVRQLFDVQPSLRLDLVQSFRQTQIVVSEVFREQEVPRHAQANQLEHVAQRHRHDDQRGERG